MDCYEAYLGWGKMRGIVAALIMLTIMVLVLPMFVRMWDVLQPSLFGLISDVSVFDTFIWTYYPWILLVFFIVAAFLLIRGRGRE